MLQLKSPQSLSKAASASAKRPPKRLKASNINFRKLAGVCSPEKKVEAENPKTGCCFLCLAEGSEIWHLIDEAEKLRTHDGKANRLLCRSCKLKLDSVTKTVSDILRTVKSNKSRTLKDGKCVVCSEKVENFANSTPIVDLLNDVVQEFSEPYVCTKCFDLLDRLDEVEREARKIRRTVTQKFLMTRNQLEFDSLEEDEDDSVSIRIRCLDDEIGGFVDFETTAQFQRLTPSQKKDNTECPNVLSESFLSELNTLMESSETKEEEANEEESETEKDEKERAVLFCTKEELENLPVAKLKNGHLEISISDLKNLKAKYSYGPKGELTVTTKSVLEKHSKDENLFDKNFGCRDCGTIFKSFNVLLRHLKKHSEEEGKGSEEGQKDSEGQPEWKYSCSECGRKFMRSANLKQHHESQHGRGEEKLCCNICQKLFCHKGNLEAHYRTHKGEKPFQCPTCGKGFTRKASMQEHVQRHKGIREKECKICKKRFYNTSYWRHMTMIHPQVEKLVHKCGVCEKTFPQLHKLRTHEQSHLAYEDRKFVCEKCPDKRFSSLNRLKCHYKTVHDLKKDSDLKLCSDCGMTFNTASALSVHWKHHHGDDRKKHHEQNLNKTNFHEEEEEALQVFANQLAPDTVVQVQTAFGPDDQMMTVTSDGSELNHHQSVVGVMDGGSFIISNTGTTTTILHHQQQQSGGKQTTIKGIENFENFQILPLQSVEEKQDEKPLESHQFK